MMNVQKPHNLNALSADLQLAIDAAFRAGQVIADHFMEVVDADIKPDGKGLVTRTDQESEQVILDTLRTHSDYAIVSEETAPHAPSADLSWIIDPIDGTTNFARKIPLFAVSIALLQGEDVRLGVLFNPIAAECVYAEQGYGAYLNGQPIRVSSSAEPASTVLFLNNGYRSADKQRHAALVDRFVNRYSLRSLGATAVEMSYLACGRAEGFICSGDELWDYAAGIVIVEEAGGKVTDWKGQHWDRRNAFICASNGSLHDELLATIADLQP
ncbi:hypothetical protein GF339_10800 [candidate division KSB3 bacterium]|uniref:Inositol-1-monophosphatase n=1 Tax=candidate division KSB3 bacterium TaxID=2044937 RepID=A0A9D5Q5Q1_9BACT|nr:hypothetical protein [candidate division KSB3 bacterium]MBD3325064.1 hypothetical protein [candidate division KSB3 bacterium]